MWKSIGKLPDAPVPMLAAFALRVVAAPTVADDGDTAPAVRSTWGAAVTVRLLLQAIVNDCVPEVT
jgi:hypothetical protein